MKNKDNMVKRIFNSLIGSLITAFGIACIANSGLGCFPITAAYIGLSKVLHIPYSVISIIVESSMLVYVCLKKEGIGISAILATTFVSIMIDVFRFILPNSTFLILFGWMSMLGWAITATACLGEGASQILTRVLINKTGKSVGFIRTAIEVTFLIIALLTAREQISWMTVVLTLGTGKVLEWFYKLLKFNPANAKHDYVIKIKNKSTN